MDPCCPYIAFGDVQWRNHTTAQAIGRLVAQLLALELKIKQEKKKNPSLQLDQFVKISGKQMQTLILGSVMSNIIQRNGAEFNDLREFMYGTTIQMKGKFHRNQSILGMIPSGRVGQMAASKWAAYETIVLSCRRRGMSSIPRHVYKKMICQITRVACEECKEELSHLRLLQTKSKLTKKQKSFISSSTGKTSISSIQTNQNEKSKEPSLDMSSHNAKRDRRANILSIACKSVYNHQTNETKKVGKTNNPNNPNPKPFLGRFNKQSDFYTNKDDTKCIEAESTNSNLNSPIPSTIKHCSENPNPNSKDKLVKDKTNEKSDSQQVQNSLGMNFGIDSQSSNMADHLSNIASIGSSAHEILTAARNYNPDSTDIKCGTDSMISSTPNPNDKNEKSSISNLSTVQKKNISSQYNHTQNKNRPNNNIRYDTMSDRNTNSNPNPNSNTFWHYLDLEGNQFGPFSTEQMKFWNQNELLDSKIRIRQACDTNEFISLSDFDTDPFEIIK